MGNERFAAILLSAGKGKRMESGIQKQYMDLCGKPLIYHAIKAFEDSPVDEIVLVAGPYEVEYCRKQIVEKYGFRKVVRITEGGRERYHSVYAGLKAVKKCDYVLIHDGARPCVTQAVIETAISGAKEYKACVVGMPVKDTIKIADKEEYAEQTPDRSRLWQIQTPQAFSYPLVTDAYEKLLSSDAFQIGVTDDAMVVESMSKQKVKLIRGDYANIKVTTPEDIVLAEALLMRQSMDRTTS